MAESNPYNEEVLNGMRLCALLLEVGTETVRTLFDENVLKAANSLHYLLQQKQREMQDYVNGTRGKPRLLIQEQYAKMYPGKQPARTAKQFDITLLILLNSILCNMPKPRTGWSTEPNERDLTPSADLVRLRLLRNTLYGHTFSIKMNSDVFMESWSALTEVLVRLGASKKQCERYKTAKFEQQEMQCMKKQLFDCIAQDISQFELLCNKFLKLFENAIRDNKISVSEEIKQHVEELKKGLLSKEDKNNLIMCGCTLSDIVNKLEAQDILFETFVPQLQKINKCLETFSSKQNELITSVSSNHKELIQKHEEIKTAVSNLPNMKYGSNQVGRTGLVEMNQQLSGIEKHFKMLIVNAPDQKANSAEIEEIATALGCIEWDFIVDLDHNSRSTGIHDNLAKLLKRHKDFSVLTYKNLPNVKEEEKNYVAKGNYCIYILANGCSEKEDCEAILDKFDTANFGIFRLLDDILSKIQEPKPMMCMILLLSGHGIKVVKSLQNMLNSVIGYKEKVIATSKSSLICLNVQENATVDPNFFTEEKIKIVNIKARQDGLCQVLFSISPGVYVDEIYTFPEIDGGDAHVSKKDIAPILPFLDLYHKHIGEIEFEKLGPDESEETQKKIQIEYHKGGVLTPEGLCLSSKSQVFVRRKEVEAVLQLVEKKYLKTAWIELHKQPFVIKHDASGGGSTVARAVLYELRNTYPCVMVKRIGEKLYEGLEQIYRKSGYPLIILIDNMIDNMEVTKNDYETLTRRIANDQIKALIIKTERTYKSTEGRESCASKMGYFVSGKLFSEDMGAFRKLYSQYSAMVKSERVFLYGLQAFLEEHIRFVPHIEECLATANECQLLLMRFCCMTWLYASFALSRRLVMTVLDASPDECCGDEIFKTMGYAQDFLLETDQGFRPAHIKIIEPIMTSVCRTTDKKTQLRQLTKDIITVLGKCVNTGLIETLQSMIYSLFIQRKRENEFWSFLVSELLNCLKNEFEDMMMNLIKCCSDTNMSSHIKVLYSRYLMYKLYRDDDSVKQAREACGLQPNESVQEAIEVDSTVLANFGTILRKTVQRKSKGGAGKLSKGLTEELYVLQQAVLAYKGAQMGKTDFAIKQNTLGLHYNGAAFIGEAYTRYQVLSLLLEHRFNSDRKRFDDFVRKTEDDFIKSCENEALKALDRMNHLWSLDLLNDDYYEETTQKAKRLKFDFLFLHSDKSARKEVKSHISKLGEDVDCDVGTLVRCFFGRNNTIGAKRSWSQLSKEELVFVIEELKRRISVSSLRSNFEDIILAMIHIRSHSDYEEEKCGNLEFAIMCASEWKKNFKDDHEAHFMYGILTFAKALDAGELQEELMKEAVYNLKRCTDICKKHKATKAFRGIRFFIGRDKGLAKIIPRVDSGYPEKDTLRRFDGRLQKHNYVNVRPFQHLLKAGITLSDPIKISQQEPLVTFNLAFAHDMLRALNYSMTEE